MIAVLVGILANAIVDVLKAPTSHDAIIALDKHMLELGRAKNDLDLASKQYPESRL